MPDILEKLSDSLHKLTNNEEYISGVLVNAPHKDDREYLYNYIKSNKDVTISDIILISLELGMIRDGDLEPLPDNEE